MTDRKRKAPPSEAGLRAACQPRKPVHERHKTLPPDQDTNQREELDEGEGDHKVNPKVQQEVYPPVCVPGGLPLSRGAVVAATAAGKRGAGPASMTAHNEDNEPGA